jgi:iron complex outermembrane receptor protein
MEFLNDLKIRAGYGVTGNQQGLSPQESDRLVNATGQTFFAGNQITNYSIMQNGNPDLRWETRTQENIGIDFAFLNSRISGSVDVFSSTTNNLLFNYTVPKPPYPYQNLTANVGIMLNQGIEISLNTHIIKTKDFNFSLNGNLSFLKNKVVDLGGTINGIYVTTDYVPWGYSSYLVKGMPIGSYYVFKHLGKDDTSKETVVNLAGNATIDTGDQSKDRYYAGSAIPTYTFGLSPVLTYKNFDVSMLFRGSGGNKIYNKIRSDFSFFESLGKSNVLKSAVSTGLFSSDYRYSSDLWLEDGSFIRFENLTIGYKFDTKQLKKISTLHISLTATNLALFTKYSGLDPELSGNGANGSGTDGGIYPRTSTIALGLNVVFK